MAGMRAPLAMVSALLLPCLACAPDGGPVGISLSDYSCSRIEEGAGPIVLAGADDESTGWHCPAPQFALETEAALGVVSDVDMPATLFEDARFVVRIEGTALPQAEHLLIFTSSRREPPSERGYTTFPIEPGPFSLELDAQLRGSTQRYLGFALARVDDHGERVIGNAFYQGVELVDRIGDLQIVLNWGTAADLDLVLIDPVGNEIPKDNDANGACLFDRITGYESAHIFERGAESGSYVVAVEMYDDCGTHFDGLSTPYTVHVLRGEEAEMHRGVFDPFEWDRTNITGEARRVVATFEFP